MCMSPSDFRRTARTDCGLAGTRKQRKAGPRRQRQRRPHRALQGSNALPCCRLSRPGCGVPLLGALRALFGLRAPERARRDSQRSPLRLTQVVRPARCAWPAQISLSLAVELRPVLLSAALSDGLCTGAMRSHACMFASHNSKFREAHLEAVARAFSLSSSFHITFCSKDS